MKKFLFRFSLLSLFMLLVSATCFSAPAPLSLDKAGKAISSSKGKTCFIFGSFKLVHTRWNIRDPKLVGSVEDVNNDCKCLISLDLLNVDTNKSFQLKLKPVTGSNTIDYAASLLSKNDEDPYWVIELPPGNYELATVTFRLTMDRIGYFYFDEDIVTIPIARDIKRRISFNAQAKQLIYIGDYDVDFKSNIGLVAVTQIYPYHQLKVKLTDNFEATKTTLINATEAKDKLDAFELISALK